MDCPEKEDARIILACANGHLMLNSVPHVHHSLQIIGAIKAKIIGVILFKKTLEVKVNYQFFSKGLNTVR